MKREPRIPVAELVETLHFQKSLILLTRQGLVATPAPERKPAEHHIESLVRKLPAPPNNR